MNAIGAHWPVNGDEPYCGKTRDGRFLHCQKTQRKRMIRKLKELRQEMRRRMRPAKNL
jgi:hypothetical protein